MGTIQETLPIEETITPKDESGVIETLRGAYEAHRPVYPIGGATSLDFGLPAKVPGLGLVLSGLDQIVDYPARDMTITVKAGVRMQTLAEQLAAEGQRLPVDTPLAKEATLGGVVATNTSGPRRYGFGTLRDYVIGIRAVDGRGRPFRGGGRVVKNVAGYDFCKLLTGSLGTLGVITELTLKVKPLSEDMVLVACDTADQLVAEKLLAALVHSQTTPSAIQWLTGPAWQEGPGRTNDSSAIGSLVVALEGTAPEVSWMTDQLATEWRELGVNQVRTLNDQETAVLWSQLVEFPAAGTSPLVIKASVRPSATTTFVELARRIDPSSSVLAHAGNGIVIVRFADFPIGDFAKLLVGKLQPAASQGDGHVVVLSCPEGELTRQAVWGRREATVSLMDAIRKQFDPRNLLNPGRFVY